MRGESDRFQSFLNFPLGDTSAADGPSLENFRAFSERGAVATFLDAFKPYPIIGQFRTIPNNFNRLAVPPWGLLHHRLGLKMLPRGYVHAFYKCQIVEQFFLVYKGFTIS